MDKSCALSETRQKTLMRRLPWHPPPQSEFPSDEDLLREISSEGWEVAAPMRGVCRAWRKALLSVRRPRLADVLIPPHELALAVMRERRWVDVSHDCKERVFRNSWLPRDRVEYARLAPQFFGPLCTKTLLRSILCLSPERFASLGLPPSLRRKEYTLFESQRVLKRALERCGGLWHLSARRQAAMGKRAPLRCPLELDSAHAEAVKRLSSLLRNDPALAALRGARKSILLEARQLRL